MPLTHLLRAATALSFSGLLLSACTIQSDNPDPATPPAAQPGQPPAGQPGAQTPAPQTAAPTGGPRSSSGAHNRRILRPIGSPAPQPGAPPTQPAPAPTGRNKAGALPGSVPTDNTSAQACVDALNAASAKNCVEARTLAQQCGTDQQAEIVAAVEQACQGS